MIRDLVEISIDMVREEKLEEIADKPRATPKSACSICCCRRPRLHPVPARVIIRS